jgi:acyl-CoA hydrolase
MKKKAPANRAKPASDIRPPVKTKPGDSTVTMTELVLPSHTNALGTIFGGVVMSWIDIAGAIAAQRYARSPVVTVSIDFLHFIVPIKIGYAVRIHAEVTYAGRTSMETEIWVDAENTVTGEVRRATTAYLTYVAVDEFGRPRSVPPFVASTNEEKKRLKEAEKRREQRLTLTKIMKPQN